MATRRKSNATKAVSPSRLFRAPDACELSRPVEPLPMEYGEWTPGKADSEIRPGAGVWLASWSVECVHLGNPE